MNTLTKTIGLAALVGFTNTAQAFTTSTISEPVRAPSNYGESQRTELPQRSPQRVLYMTKRRDDEAEQLGDMLRDEKETPNDDPRKAKPLAAKKAIPEEYFKAPLSLHDSKETFDSYVTASHSYGRTRVN